MRSIVAVILCACFLQAVWLSISSGQDIDCSTLQDKSECCSSNSSCVYVDCVVNDTSVDGCYNTTGEAACDAAAEAVDICEASGTTPASSDAGTTETPEETAVNCSQHSSDKTACCAAVNSDNTSACIFYTCTNNDQVTGTECAAADATPTCPEEGDTPGDNSCNEESEDEGTTQAPTNTDNDNETTEAPVEEDVDCATLSEDQGGCCSAGNSAACIFFNCTDANRTVTSTVCAAANATPECTGNNTPSANICEETGSSTTPSGSENPSQAPSSGEEGGGQGFDAASFIGGIVLCAGTVAIAFFALKFYRSRQERNYQSM